MFLLQIPEQLTQSVGEQTEKVFDWADKIKNISLDYAPKIIGALLVLLIGNWFVKWVSKITLSIIKRRNLDASLQSFIASSVKIGLSVLLYIIVISILGVDTTSFAALLAGAGLAIGAAMNGSLGNIAGGVMILLLKPFKLGDIIEAGDYYGIVQEIGIVNTTILTPANKTVYLPNGMLSTEVITNLSAQDTLRIDLQIPVGDETDIEFARKVAVAAMMKHPDIIKAPLPSVEVDEVNDDGIILNLFPQIKMPEYDNKNPRALESVYYSVKFGALELVKKAFQENNIEGPSASIELKKQ